MYVNAIPGGINQANRIECVCGEKKEEMKDSLCGGESTGVKSVARVWVLVNDRTAWSFYRRKKERTIAEQIEGR